MNDLRVGRLSFTTGSSLVKGIEPKDKDIVVRCKTQDEALKIASEKGYTDINTSMVGDPRFVSIRDGEINYILIWTDEMFFKMEAFSGALKLLQLKDKAKRIELSKACLYGTVGWL